MTDAAEPQALITAIKADPQRQEAALILLSADAPHAEALRNADLGPGARIVTLGDVTPDANAILVPWAADTPPPADAILDGRVHTTICDATGFPEATRRALFLALFPALDFGGRYLVSAPGPDFGGWLGAIGQRLSRGGLDMSPARQLHGQSAEVIVETTTAAVAFRPNLVVLERDARPGAPLRLLRVVPLEDVSASVDVVQPSERYERLSPTVHDNPRWLNERLNAVERSVVAPSGRIGVIRDALIVGDGVVIAKEGVIQESLLNISGVTVIPHLLRLTGSTYATMGWSQAETTLNQSNLVLLMQSYDGNYGHWLTDTLPRAGLVAQRYRPDTCHYILRGWEPQYLPLFRESLGWCGIPTDNLIVGSGLPIRVQELIFPTPMSQNPWIHAPFVIRFLEGIAARVQAAFAAEAAIGQERIYLSRSRFGRRVIVNEDEVSAFLGERGYTTLYPEQMTFTEQVLALSRARFIVGGLGAAMTNIAFAPRGVDVLALATEHMPDDFFWDITAQKAGRYISLHGKATDPEKGMQSDFHLRLDRLRDVFGSFDPG